MNISSISNATARNWERLGTNEAGKLTKRANKVKSKKRIIPYEYISHKKNIQLLEALVEIIISNNYSYMDCIYTLCLSQLKSHDIYENQNVQQVLSEYINNSIIEELTHYPLPTNEFDFIGAIYQALLFEGNKNRMGSYYTPQKVSIHMTQNLDFSFKQKFLDPCCGSGSFLLSLNCNDPNLIYGIDNDAVAVMIAKINLLCKYSNIQFIPHVYCLNYLEANSLLVCNPVLDELFDYIYTNPPWGAVTSGLDDSLPIQSGESFSMFFFQSFLKLKPNGFIRFLFPESILNVKVHKDIRSFILNNCSLRTITFYKENFTGVVTSYVDILVCNADPSEKVDVIRDGKNFSIMTDSFRKTDNLIFNILTSIDISIIEKVKKISPYDLSQSIWALGIVTGNNKEKISDAPKQGMEPIFTGKEITQYILKPAKKYVFYDRKQFQQVAKDEIYRSPEKLVYKFISNKLVFAYDDKKRLFLNSANILIPSIPGMSVKTVMAFLNSDLYSFLYKKLFGEIKILKGNLLELPFPAISVETNIEIERIIDQVIISQNASLVRTLQKIIYDVFQLTEDEVEYISSQIK